MHNKSGGGTHDKCLTDTGPMSLLHKQYRYVIHYSYIKDLAINAYKKDKITVLIDNFNDFFILSIACR
jgi:hypothetical protein